MLVFSRQFLVLKEIRFNNLVDCITKQVSIYCSLCSNESITLKRNKKKENNSKTLVGGAQHLSFLDSSLNRRRRIFSDIEGFTTTKCSISGEEIRRKFPEKVKALSDFFNCSEDKAISLIQKYNFLTKPTMESVICKLQVLLEHGISKEELLNDLWILTYTVPTIEERLNLLKELNLVPVKPWLLRCSSHILARMAKNRENNRLAMEPYNNVEHYLKERLGMTDAQTKVFSMKHPPVMRVKVAKLKEIIDFLFSEGFKPIQIYHTPRILCHSLITIKDRLKKLRDLHYEPHSLLLLCKTKRTFDKFLSSIEKETRS